VIAVLLGLLGVGAWLLLVAALFVAGARLFAGDVAAEFEDNDSSWWERMSTEDGA
jgi:hypothetical protein